MDSRGVINSPKLNSTQMYAANQTCQWTVAVRTGRIMKLTFTSLEVISSNNECHEDYLMVCYLELYLTLLLH